MQIPHPQIEVTVADFWQVGFEITIMILKMEKNGARAKTIPIVVCFFVFCRLMYSLME